MKQLSKFAALMLLCLAGSMFAQINLLPDAGFEGPVSSKGLPNGGWWLYKNRGEGRAVVDSTVAHSGQASVRLDPEGAARFSLASPAFSVTAGDEIRISAWIRADNAHPGFFGLSWRKEGKGLTAERITPTNLSAGAWMFLSGVFKAPAAATAAEVLLTCTNSGKVWFDDVSAVIASPFSMALAGAAKPWPGPQTIIVHIVNHQADGFRGVLRAVIGTKTNDIPLLLTPGAEVNVKAPITLSGIGKHDYKISLVDGTGTTRRMIEGKFKTTAPLVLYPPCPYYHAVGAGSEITRLDTAIALNPTKRPGTKLVVTLRNAAGADIETQSASAASGDVVGVNLHVPVSAPGDFVIAARLLDAAGKELSKEETSTYVRPALESDVSLGPDGFLRVAGQPEFPLGLYNAGHFEEMAAAGFNATHNYSISGGEVTEPLNHTDIELKERLDESWKNGLRMMVELPRDAVEKAQWAQVRRRILTFRNHPGLLCWGSEERVARGIAPLENIEALYKIVHELDPHHPLVLGDTWKDVSELQTDRRHFFPDEAMDVGIWWWYPIPVSNAKAQLLEGRDASGLTLEPPAWLTTTLSKKPLWIAIQSYQKPHRDARFPTPDEYRCMAYISIINGVKGLYFYVGSGQKDYEGKPAGLLNKPELAHWDYVQKLARELHDLSPVFMAPKPSAPVTVSPTNTSVEFTTRALNGKIYLLAANISNQPQTVHFTGEIFNGKQIHILDENHQATITGENMTDTFGPYGVHVYQLD